MGTWSMPAASKRITASRMRQLPHSACARAPYYAEAAGRDYQPQTASWVEPQMEARILHRSGLTADRVHRPVFEGLVAKKQPRRTAVKSTPATSTAAENIQRLLPDAVVSTRE